MSEAVLTSSPEESTRPNSLGAWTGTTVLIAAFAAALALFPPLRDASAAVASPTWMKFFGHFHVIILHLPVGILALVALMELLVLFRHRTSAHLETATTLGLMVGGWSAALSVVFGIFLARKGGFDSAEFYAHQALGVVATIGLLATLVLKLIADKASVFTWPYRIAFGISLAVISVGAHFGGNLVHGSDYLTRNAPPAARKTVEKFEGLILARFEPPQRAKPPVKSGTQPANVQTPATAMVYAALIAPVLEKNCNSCHNAEKSKGDLRLDSHELILKGGKAGDAVVAGQPEKSRVILSMQLPLDDDDHMPPAKKPQPDKDEIALISWWVKEGASRDLKVVDAKLPDDVKPLAQKLLAGGKTGSAGGTPPIMLGLAEVATQVDPAVAEAMKKINGSGASLSPVAADANELRFTALNVARDYTDASLKDLEPISGRIVALDLAKTKVTDAGIAVIARMPALRELHLENTAITDAGAAQLKALASLEYLNLYGTKVTDKTLAELAGLAKLKALYLWQSGVTKAGVDAFKAGHPGAVVNFGWTEADNAKVVAATDAKPVPAPEKKPETPVPAPSKPAAAVAVAKAIDANALLYKDIVAPILEARCVSCHGKEKSKGKLRMHTFADLLKGGSDGATTVVAGKPDESLMVKRSLLPVDDDDHMPPKDEKQATKEEIAILKWWIEQGASESLTLAAAKKTPEIEAALKVLVTAEPGKGSGPAKSADQKPKAKPLTAAEKKSVAEVTAKMTALNASLMSVALDTEQLRFGCINAADKFGDKELGELAPIAPQIVWVDLGKSKVTDAGLAVVAKMVNLERLHLENTAVTDAGLDHIAGLPQLEYLNLYGTKVTDAGIAKLAGLKSLRKLFLWQTAASKDGAKKLEAAIPGLVVNIGLSEAEIAKLVEEIKPPQAPDPAKPADPKAKGKGKAKAAPAKTVEPAAKPADPNIPPAPPVKTEKK